MISSIILAAGQSRRMGQPKALLPWGEELLVGYEVRQLREAGADEVIVVLGDHSDDIQRRMKGIDCRVMFNAMHQMGRAGTLRVGARAASRDADAIVIMNVDQPRPADFIRHLLDEHRQGAVATVPVCNGRRGHPVVVAGSLRDDLLRATDETEGLRGVLAEHEANIREVPADDLCELDLNTPDDYQAALRRFGLAS
jgi:molybdenum cofactor cytidylyltransferase